MLVVDDDEIVLELFARLLLANGFQVSKASSGRTALELVRRRRFSLVVLDLKLPDLSGLQVLRQMRRDRVATPVLLVSGVASVEAAVEAMHLGAADVLQKPIRGADLVKKVTALLNGRHARLRSGRALGQPKPDTSSTASNKKDTSKIPLDGLDLLSLHRLQLGLVRAASRPDSSAAFFIRCAKALRDVTCWSESVSVTQIEHIRALLERPAELDDSFSEPHIERILWSLERLGPVASERHVAADLRITTERVGAELLRQFGACFPEVKRALRIRRGAYRVAISDEQFAQIAYQLEYDHPSQFSREFRAILGLSPRQFRRLRLTSLAG